MKKNLILMVALAGMMSMASCQSDEPAVASTGDEAVVTFKAQIPQNIQSRSFADGEKATDMTALVYQKNADKTYTLVFEKNPVVTDKTAEVSFNLVKGKTYAVVFWAQNPNAPYSLDKDSGTIDMNYNAEGEEANNEVRDAFYDCETVANVSESQTKDVTLKRPFGQLNIGTSDLEEATLAGYDYKEAIVTAQCYQTMNLLTGAVEGDIQTIKFNQAAFPEETFPSLQDEDGVSPFTYLSMNYLLMGTKRELTTVSMDLVTSEESKFSDTKSLTFDNVPICRNYRTNIYGALLTNQFDYNITIDENFKDGDQDYYIEISDGADLYPAMQRGLNITLTNDISSSYLRLSQTTSAGPVKSTIDLNGHTITLTASTSQPINYGNELTLKNGTVINTAITNSTLGLWEVTNGSLTLENMNIQCDCSAIYPKTSDAVVNIKSSTISASSYVVATNASSSYTPEINIEKSVLSSHTPLCINVPANVTLKNNSITGTIQAALLRGGTYYLYSNTFYLDITGLDAADLDSTAAHKLNENWGSGNDAPVAALVIGNRASSYQYPTTFTSCASNRAYVINREDGGHSKFYNVYIYANQADDMGVYFPYQVGFTTKITVTTPPIEEGRGVAYASNNIWYKKSGEYIQYEIQNVDDATAE